MGETTTAGGGRTGAERRGERGAVTLPFIALGIGTLLLILMLVLNSGLANLGRTQLQVVADNAARSALLAVGQANLQDPDTSITELQRIARSTAEEVAEANTVIQGGISAGTADLEIELGRFRLNDGTFEPVGMMQIPTAVRVTARRSSEATSGPFQSLFASRARPEFNEVQSDAVSISSLRCKNLVFVVDLSGSFRANVDFVQGALLTSLDILEAPDRVGVVAFAGGVIEQSIDGQQVSSTVLVDPTDVAIRDSIALLSLADGRVGTDIGAGIRRADQLVREGQPDPNCENLVIVLSDGNNVGASDAATVAAAAALSQSSSIATVPIGASFGGQALLESIVSGFGQTFPANFNEEDLASKTLRAVSTIPPILVR
jgi:Mg-chelatase subunit ChlD